MSKKKLVVLTGAGISAESGIPTFRDSGGLWEGYDVMEVASPEGWRKDPELVLNFYNERRKQARQALPNQGHLAIADLESDYNVTVVTQNIDDLHERAGSTQILHLHGSVFESRSTLDPSLVYKMETLEINIGDRCERGSQLRPNIVWFGEAVPMIEPAMKHVMEADVFVVAGTSMVVYPAAGLIDYVPLESPIFVVDPVKPEVFARHSITFIEEKASVGLEQLKKLL